MKRVVLLALAISYVTFFGLSGVVHAAKPTGGSTGTQNLGIDISYPQCSKSVPTNQKFAIVGVNDGVANDTNRCLAKQLAWGAASPGGLGQDPLQLYVNTGNPAGLKTDSWKMTNLTAYTSTPQLLGSLYGECTVSSDGVYGQDSAGCAWLYGWNRALEDVEQRFPSAARQAGINSDPTAYRWWLDVETVNSWKTGDTDADYESNVAVLEGMAAYFSSYFSVTNGTSGVRYGLYSTNYQWGQITAGKLREGSLLTNVPNWYPVGRARLLTAKNACNQTPLTAGSTIVLTQFVSSGLDYDYSCTQ